MKCMKYNKHFDKVMCVLNLQNYLTNFSLIFEVFLDVTFNEMQGKNSL